MDVTVECDATERSCGAEGKGMTSREEVASGLTSFL